MTTELQSRPIHYLPPHCSEDGRWWWDGARWVEAAPEHSRRMRSLGRLVALVLALLLLSLLILAV